MVVGSPSHGGGRAIATDEALAKVDRERTQSYITAWEEKERANSNNKYEKAISKISAWEAAKQSATEAKMRQAQEALERKKAAILERMKNDFAEIHRLGQEKRAQAQAQRSEEFVKIDEEAARHRSIGEVPPTRTCLCFEF